MCKTVSRMLLTLLLAGVLTLAFSTRSIKAKAGMITVPDDYTTIQEAINNATEGDTVYVRAGVYNESININKSIQLVGEDKATTVINGSGSGSVAKVSANNVSIVNFTIRNAGKMWDGAGYPPSCISANNVRYVEVKDNILTDAAVCVWFYSSSFIEIGNNIVYNGTLAGIIAYASSNIVVQRNFVDSCGLMGIHLDGNCINCNITENTIKNTLEGMEIEKSGKNLIARNQFLHNNVSIILNQCNGLNTLRENNMTSDWYNLIVWGVGINDFLHYIDTTNIVNGKKIYYFINSSDLLVNSSNCPDVGYLAFVNCTRITVKDVDLSFNRDGLLLVQSNYCNLVNITIRGNRGPLLYGGLIFFNSANNTIANSLISNNSVGVCTRQSNGNIFYHNNFINNMISVIPNYLSPFQSPQPSTVYSKNVWDDGYPSGGNYWSNYVGVDIKKGSDQNQPGSDGIGDTPYVISIDNMDNYPLMYPCGSPPPPTYTLTITTTIGGTTDPQPGTYTYFQGQNVPVQATPNTGFSFKHWLFDSEERTENPIAIIMNANYTLEAYFIDATPPTTIDDYDGLWHNSDFTITLVAIDYGSGVAETYYRINNGLVKRVSVDGHPLITTEGANNTLEYWSVDNAGNEEIPHKFLTSIKLDKTAPVVIELKRESEGDVEPGQTVKIMVNATDSLSEVKDVILSYCIGDSLSWTDIPMTFNVTSGFYETLIQVHQTNVVVKYKITVYDNAGNFIVEDNAGQYYTYTVIPDFLLIPLTLVIL
ncbi:MAG: NosD domain-containing protein, partial [Candidatus Bathyarchaeia archaeon]